MSSANQVNMMDRRRHAVGAVTTKGCVGAGNLPFWRKCSYASSYGETECTMNGPFYTKTV